ncbi:hypothetical protein H2203_001631 [Taxawa tesnikishii (nom. ined.)]|nr:hypothetical protein H2203_001631 [Dothideales sp. JES 119]
MQSLIRGISERFTPNASSSNLAGFQREKDVTLLFPKTDPAVDGEQCLHDCDSCTIHYPNKFTIDEDEKLYGHVNGWSTHLIIGTGKTDWVRDVEDEKGSVMEAVGKTKGKISNGKMMLSASNMPVPHTSHDDPAGSVRTDVLLLPAFTVISNVTPQNVPDLITHVINNAPTNTTPLQVSQSGDGGGIHGASAESAPLLRREFERHLRPLGLYRDLDDARPGGVGIYFISHRARENQAADGTPAQEAAQCIWLARVRPEDCENIVRYTILQGKVVKPERQLRGGFDRSRQVVSW